MTGWKDETMLTIHEARERLEAYFAQHPPAMSGELYISDDWNEDDSDYLPAWGAREFFVEHRQSFVRMDNLALFIDKQTGDIRRDRKSTSLKSSQQCATH